MTQRILIAALAALCLTAAPRAQAIGGDLYRVQANDTLYRIARASNMTVDLLRRLNPGVVDDVISVGQTLRLTNRAATAPGSPTPGSPSAGASPSPGASSGQIPTAPASGSSFPTAPTAAAPSGAVTHVVGANDTLFRIAQRYGMPIGELRRLNGITGDAIQLGQRLVVVPAAGVTPPMQDGVAVNPPSAGTMPNAPGGTRPGRPPSVTETPTRPTPIRRDPPRQWTTTDTTIPADLAHFVEPGETLFSIAAAYGFSVDALIGGNTLSTAPLVPGTILYLPAPVDPSWAAARTLPDAAEVGLALVYPDVLAGRPTASGEPYDPLALTASHRDLPLGTVVLVTNPASGRSTFVRIADRGPVSRSYLLELSAAAATAIELDPNAARQVELRLVP